MQDETKNNNGNTHSMEVYKDQSGRETLVVRDTSEYANLLDTARFVHLQRLAKVYSDSKIVPDHFRGDPASVFIVLEMALRLKAHPFMMLQNTYMVHGKPGFEAKVVIAMLNASGRLAGPLDWKPNGKTGDDAGWVCYGTLAKSNRIIQAELTWKTVKQEGWLEKPGSKWKSMAETMFKYRSAMQLARLYFPDLLMGIQTVDEVEDVVASEAWRGDVVDVKAEPAGEIPPAHPAEKNQNQEEAVIERLRDKIDNDLFGDGKPGRSSPRGKTAEKRIHVTDATSTRG